MSRVFRLRPVQRWPEDWMRDVQVIFSQVLSLCALVYLMSGCSWTPRVETSIYEGPQVSVSLITVSDESFEADHPVTLQTDTLAHVLRGLQIRRSKRLLQKIFSGEAIPQRVLTEEQIAILAPQLQKAFSHVTPEEHVIFQTTGTHETGIRAIKGIMYVHGDDLYVTLNLETHSSHTSTKSAGKGLRADQEGSRLPVVVFSPKEALRAMKQPHGLLGGEKTNHIVINVPLLASFHRQNPTNALQTEQERSKTLPALPPNFESTIYKETDKGADTSSTAHSPTSARTPKNTDTQTLIEEIKTLRKELAEQKKAIEQLTHEATGTR